MSKVFRLSLALLIILGLSVAVSPGATASNNEPGALSRVGSIRGRITRVGSDFVTIRRTNRLRKYRVYVDQSTDVKFEGRESSVSEYAVDEQISTRYHIEGHRRVATVMDASGEFDVEGIITSINLTDGTFRIRDDEGTEIIGVDTDANTIFERNDEDATLADFVLDDHVEVHFNLTDGHDVATRVESKSEADE